MIAYLTEQGAVIRRKRERIHVEKNGEILQEILLIDLNALVIMGNIQITTQASTVLMQRGIEVIFLTLSGRFKGKLCGSINRNIFLRMAQYERFRLDRVKYARAFVAGKIANQLEVVTQYRWGGSEQRKSLKQLAEESNQKIAQCETVEALYGIEGCFANAYFEIWGSTFKEKIFVKRVKHPAFDFVNACLNLAYALLNNEIVCKLETTGFETTLGFLHSPHYGRCSLACDMIEEFRAEIVDRFVKNVIDKSVIVPSDFETTTEGCRFKDEPLKLFLRRYQENYAHYNSIVSLQVHELRKAILDGSEYEPWRLKETI